MKKFLSLIILPLFFLFPPIVYAAGLNLIINPVPVNSLTAPTITIGGLGQCSEPAVYIAWKDTSGGRHASSKTIFNPNKQDSIATKEITFDIAKSKSVDLQAFCVQGCPLTTDGYMSGCLDRPDVDNPKKSSLYSERKTIEIASQVTSNDLEVEFSNPSKENIRTNSGNVHIVLKNRSNSFNTKQEYAIVPNNAAGANSRLPRGFYSYPSSTSQLIFDIPIAGAFNATGDWTYQIVYADNQFIISGLRGLDLSNQNTIFKGSYTILPANGDPINGDKQYKIHIPQTTFHPNDQVKVDLIDVQIAEFYTLWFQTIDHSKRWTGQIPNNPDPTARYTNYSATITVGEASNTTKTLCITNKKATEPVLDNFACDYSIPNIKVIDANLPLPPIPTPGDSTIITPGTGSTEITPTPIPPRPPCKEGYSVVYKKDSTEIASKGPTTTVPNEIDVCTKTFTAIGDIATDPSGFVTRIFGFLLSISGGIAVLMIIYSGYNFMTSQGNPETVKEARERLTSAIVGLLFIIFSLVILQIIGVNILHIPGFTN